MNIFSVVVSGIVGTMAISMVMALGPKMGLPKMDIVGMLSTMFGKPNRTLGWIMHLMMGVIFALIYAFLWSLGIGSASWFVGLLFGIGHWLVVGVMFALIPIMHAGIKSGEVEEPGMWMTNQGGLMAFVGGLMGHMIFGIVAALIYSLF
ncbi:MAG: hypothetical protein KAH12_03355 [Anaerolineales bacterium]|nr:hypothetical protein [Anaerolineales bacterium]